MSLLMQALKKAERAKQNSGEAELEKPSEAFDELLALSPQAPATAPAPAPASAPSLGDGLSLEPLSLTPLADAPAPAPTAAAPAAPLAPLELSADSLPPIPVLSVAEEAIHDPVPPQARHQTETPSPTPAAAPEAVAPSASARVKAELKAEMAAAAASAPPEAAAKGAKGGRAGKEGGAAAARARAAASGAAGTPGTDVGGLDPAKLRLAVLGGIVLLILLGYGYYFWQAVYGPGSGARLPMVPMPPPNATGATSGVVVVPGSGGQAPAAAATAVQAEEEAAPSDAQRAREASLAAQVAALQLAIQQQQSRNSTADTVAPMPAAEPLDVKVVRTAAEPKVDPSLSGGYSALSSGDLANARSQYDAALRQDPNNRDALLGAAAVALRQQQADKAGAYYNRLLELDPNDPDALAGLVGLRQGDPGQTEQRLIAALRSNPESGPVLFALGNLYARQGRWSEAQQSYFRAYSALPGNADYAVNLAIGLDRLNQGKLALGYYQKALALAQDKPASFDRDAIQRRVQELNQAAAR